MLGFERGDFIADLHNPHKREVVAKRTKACDDPRTHCAGVAFGAVFFARVDIADMHLDDGHAAASDRIGDGDRGVRECGGVDDDAGVFAAYALLKLVDDLALKVALKKLELDIVLLGLLGEILVDLIKGDVPIDMRLAVSEDIETWSLNDKNFHNMSFM